MKLTGGEAFQKKLDELSKNITKAAILRIGWPEDAVYKNGMSVGLVAAINEFGRPGASPDKPRQPPRPFLRQTIAENSEHWGGQIANLLVDNDYDSAKVLNLMGIEISGQVQDSILAFMEPPLAARTIKAKGFDKPLIETGDMLRKVTYEVAEPDSTVILAGTAAEATVRGETITATGGSGMNVGKALSNLGIGTE